MLWLMPHPSSNSILDSPCVIELFSGLKELIDAGRIALDSTSWSFALTDASLFSVDAK